VTTPDGLTDTERAELRAELEREIAALERSMSVTAEAARPVQLDQTAVGRVSRADAMQNQQLSVDLHERERARYAQLLDALERMKDGTYGLCQRCGTAIPFGRLLVFPEARMCAVCSARSGG
jgi:DnaK suppressor protein